MNMLKYIGVLLFVTCSLNSVSQEVRNIRVTQSGNRVHVLYDLAGIGKAVKVDLYYTINEGKTWNGPLKNLSGEISNVSSPATDRRIVWDALNEAGEIKGNIQFKIDVDFSKARIIEPVETPAGFRKHRTMKNIWLTTSVVTGGAGVLAMIKSNRLYDAYKSAEEDAADIHKKIETYDVVYPVAFGIASISAVNFIIQAGKQGKAKKQVSIQPLYLPNGGGALLTFKF